MAVKEREREITTEVITAKTNSFQPALVIDRCGLYAYELDAAGRVVTSEIVVLK